MRRVIMGLVVLMGIAVGKVSAQTACNLPEISQSTLTEYAQRKNVNVGAFFSECLWNPPQGAACQRIMLEEYRGQLMPFEYDWVSTEPTRGTYDFRSFDVAVGLAKSTNSKIHFFHLIWDPNVPIQPSWLFPSNTNCGAWTRAELLGLMKNYIQATIAHGNGAVAAWNVVNETIAETNGLVHSSCFYKIVGPDYVDWAFKYAKEANPKGILVMSDYFGEGGFGRISRPKTDNFIEFVRNARDRGVPIEAVGIQNHLLSKDGYPFGSQYREDLKYFLEKARAISVPVLITEMDVYQGGHSQEEVAKVYEDTMAICLRYSNCMAVETFGISDEYSAAKTVPGLGDAKPLLFDNTYQRKPAYYGMMKAMKQDTARGCGAVGDVNGDGKVDLVDFSLWKQEYLKKVTTLKADFNNDGVVNLVDFSIWKREYIKQ